MGKEVSFGEVDLKDEEACCWMDKKGCNLVLLFN